MAREPIYATHAPRYLAAGWPGVLPLPERSKYAPPQGFTGSGGRWPSEAEVRAWVRMRPADNIGLRLPAGVVGLDVDAYKAGGAASWNELRTTLPALPPTVRTTSRDDGASGIRLYRVRPGVELAGNPRPGIEIVQHHHRYAVAPPSIHPEGRPYRWIDDTGAELDGIPNPAELPELPVEWVVALSSPAPVERAATAPAGPSPGLSLGVLESGFSDSAAAWFDHRYTWARILEADGWHHHHAEGEAVYWTRPGKATRDGWSAATHGERALIVWSGTALDELGLARCGRTAKDGAGWSMAKFDYYAARQHRGDRSVAAAEIRAAMRLEAPAPGPSSSTSSTPAAVGGADPFEELLDELGGPTAAPAPGLGTLLPAGVPDEAGEDWAPVDVREIARRMAAGELEKVLPTVLRVEGTDLALFYPARLNTLFGESGGGKTWVALAAVLEVLRAGKRALVVDYEDSPEGIVERLLALGAAPDELEALDYRNPSTGIGFGVAAFEAAVAAGTEYALVVVDSTGEAMAAGGVDSNADAEVARWFNVLRYFSRLPGAPAVLNLDHIPKSNEAPASYAIGSQRKRAALNGASYRVDTIIEPAKGKAGLLRLTVTKDRLGNRPKGSIAADVHMIPGGGDDLTIEARVNESAEAAAKGETFRPTVLMERVSRWLEINPGATTRAVYEGVKGAKEHVSTALEVLLDEGWIRSEAGPRRAVFYTSATPYRHDDEAFTSPDRVSGPAGRNVVDSTVPPFPDCSGTVPGNTGPRLGVTVPVFRPPVGDGTLGTVRRAVDSDRSTTTTVPSSEQLTIDDTGGGASGSDPHPSGGVGPAPFGLDDFV